MTAAVTIDALLVLVGLLLFIPCAVVFLEMSAAGRGPKAVEGLPASASASVVVLMPAHDEEAGIAESIRSVLHQLQAGDRLLVVADNCGDGTAAVARSLGASVVERNDAQCRGKGFALDFGVRALEPDPPEVVVVVDADCVLGPGALAALRRTCSSSVQPVQALYLMQPPAGTGLGQRVAAFAWIVKNQLRPRGAARLGWPCQLMGTGMAFPWPAIRNASLATSHLVEDMQLGLEMAAAGTPPVFCEEAVVSSEFPSSREGLQSQRTRWEHGHIATIVRDAPRFAWRAARKADLALLAMALDLAVPPLAALVLALVVYVALAIGAWLFSHAAVPLSLAALSLVVLGSAVLLAWRQEGRRFVSARELAWLPIYVVAKIPLYLRLFTKRQAQWVRTKRDGRQL